MTEPKPMGMKNYGSIPHLESSKIDQKADKKLSYPQELILTKKARDYNDLIIVQEKVDGSNVGVCKLRGLIQSIGRAGYLARTSPHKQHQIFAKWVTLNWDRFDGLLKEGERVCGEWLYQVHTLKYNLEHEPFVVFDIFDKDNQRITYLELIKRISKHDFIPANLVHIGQPISIQNAMKRLDKGGHGCQEEPEGIVYRLEKRGKVEFLAKYVRPGKPDGLYMEEEIVQENADNSLKK